MRVLGLATIVMMAGVACGDRARLAVDAASGADAAGDRDGDVDATPPGTVSVEIRAAEGGRVTSTPAGIDCPGACVAAFAAGATVTLHDLPAGGWRFVSWTPQVPLGIGEADTFEVPIESGRDMHVIARFIEERFAWLTPLDGPASERILVVEARGDELVVAGSTDGPTAVGGPPLPHGGARDPLISARSASDGSHRWSTTLGGTGDAAVVALAILPDGDVVAGGWFVNQFVLGSTTYDGGGARTFLARFAAADGALRWGYVPPIGSGPFGNVHAIAATADGGFVVCGSGTGPLTRFDGDGVLTHTGEASSLTNCFALTAAGDGWTAAGWGSSPHSIAWTRYDATLAVVDDGLPNEWSGNLAVDDIVAVGGGAVIAATVPNGVTGYDSVLLHVRDGATPAVVALAGSTPIFGRSLALAGPLADGTLLVAQRESLLAATLQRWTPEPLARTANYDLYYPQLFDIDLARAGQRVWFAADGTEDPLIGWHLHYATDGGFVGELLPPP